jgi:hypoxanthine-guanine phosphoribosyltransferase
MDILINKAQLADRIKTMAEQLEQHTTKHDNGLPPVFICVLNGAYKFFTDLVSEYNGLC